MGQRQDGCGNGPGDSTESESIGRPQLLGNPLPRAQAGALRLPGRAVRSGLGTSSSPKAYHVDPSKPIGSIKEAWEAARLRAAKILKGETKETDSKGRDRAVGLPLPRSAAHGSFPDAECGNPDCQGCQDRGLESHPRWYSWRERYGHFSLNDLRGAVESISGSGIEAGSPVFSPVSENVSEVNRPN